MISYISSWAEQVIIAVIIGTILEMILPNGNSKNYIKTLIGIYILYTVISPVITLAVGKDLKIDYSEYEKYFNTKVDSDISNNAMEDTFKTEIKKQMKNDIEEMGFHVNSISMKLDLENGSITKLDLSISKDGKKSDNEIAINKIEIGKLKERENDLSFQEIEKIKELIQNNYGITYEEIYINSI